MERADGRGAGALPHSWPWGCHGRGLHIASHRGSGWRLAWPWRASLPGARWVGAAARLLLCRKAACGRERRIERGGKGVGSRAGVVHVTRRGGRAVVRDQPCAHRHRGALRRQAGPCGDRCRPAWVSAAARMTVCQKAAKRGASVGRSRERGGVRKWGPGRFTWNVLRGATGTGGGQGTPAHIGTAAPCGV